MEGIDVLAGLVEIIRDDKKYGRKIAELTALDKSAADLMTKARQYNDDANAQVLQARALRDEAAATHNDLHQSLIPREDEVKKGAQSLVERQRQLGDHEREFKTYAEDKRSELLRRENAVNARERRVDGREAAVGEREAQAQMRIAEYDARLAALERVATGKATA